MGYCSLILTLSILLIAHGQHGNLYEEISVAVVQKYCTPPYSSMNIPPPPLNDFAFVGLSSFVLEATHHNLVRPLASKIKWDQSISKMWTNYEGQINMACGITTAVFPLPYNFTTYGLNSNAESFECMDRTNFRGYNPAGNWSSCHNDVSMFSMFMNQCNWTTYSSTMTNQTSWPEADAFYLIPFYSRIPISSKLQDGIASIMSNGDGGPYDVTGPLLQIPFFLETQFPTGVWLNTTDCNYGQSKLIDLTFLKDKVQAKINPLQQTWIPFNGYIGSGNCYTCPTYFRANIPNFVKS